MESRSFRGSQGSLWPTTGPSENFLHKKKVLKIANFQIIGSRPNEDLGRIKESEEHCIDVDEGWGWTAFVGGRCKLRGKKKGTRPWRAWRICLCKGGAHVDIPEDIEYGTWGHRGDPPANYDPDNLPWCTNCPVAAMSLILKLQWRLPGKGCLYRKFGQGKKKADRKFCISHSGNPVRDAMEWFRAQGVDRPFDTNAGRPGLGRWLAKLGVPFGPGFQYHGDLPDTWGGAYQTDNFRKDGHKNRQQSKDPDTALEGLRMFAAWLGLGLDKRPPLTRFEQLMLQIVEGQDKILGSNSGMARARRVVRGLDPDSSDDDEFYVRKPKREVKEEKRKKKRKRIAMVRGMGMKEEPPAVKLESDESSDDEPIRPPRKRKRVKTYLPPSETDLKWLEDDADDD